MHKLPVIQAARTCGDCTVCCTHIGVRELNKPRGVACPHLLPDPGVGCGIYETRPASCSAFRCHWLDGFIEPEEWRPDKIGIMVTRLYQPFAKRTMLTVFEAERGALMKPTVIRFIGAAILNDELIMTLHDNHSKLGILAKDPLQAKWLLDRMYERARKAGIDVSKPLSLFGKL
jgi:hypothetical protein